MDISCNKYTCREWLYRSGDGAFSAVSSFTGMVILAALIYLLNVWLQDGDDIVSGLLLFLAPACGLIIRFMVGYGKR
ncbi:TPA: YfdY family protein [Salmonella enterica subsp. enterica serovar Charity]